MTSPDKLTKEQILAALARLDELLREKGVIGEIRIFGGAAMSRHNDTLRESLSHVANPADFIHAIRNFLDRFKVNPATSWMNRSCRKMAVPFFAAKSPNMKAILLQESPAAFRVRNLFVSANALSRA